MYILLCRNTADIYEQYKGRYGVLRHCQQKYISVLS